MQQSHQLIYDLYNYDVYYTNTFTSIEQRNVGPYDIIYYTGPGPVQVYTHEISPFYLGGCV
jgi:hypothetical protein